MTFVRILASILICLLLLHGVCMGRCLGDGSRVAQQSAVPPCHDPQGTSPDENRAPMPSSTCTEGPALEGKNLQALKSFIDVAILPEVLLAVTSTPDIIGYETSWAGVPASVPLAHYSVLRL